MDFAKLVEAFERHDVTFVSVTQQFNTTTSMGRLTLNILLSFAQFEREVIGERIRDKFAASRSKGMWMGGWRAARLPGRGQEAGRGRARGRAGAPDLRPASPALGSALKVARELNAAGEVTKRWNANGSRAAAGPGPRATSTRSSPTGSISARRCTRASPTPASTPRSSTRSSGTGRTRVMAEPAHRRGAATRAQVPMLLKGLIFGPNGRPMSPSHTTRRGRVHRYYVTREAIAEGYDTCPVTSVPAADVEGAVLAQVQRLLDHARDGRADLGAPARGRGRDHEREVLGLLADFGSLWAELFPAEQARIMKLLVERVDVQADGLEVRLRAEGLASLVAELRQATSGGEGGLTMRRRDPARGRHPGRADPDAARAAAAAASASWRPTAAS